MIDGFVSPFYVVLVMTLANSSLHQRLQGTVTLEDAMRFVEQIASGLAHVHTKRIIHRDLHSGNVLVCASAGGPDSLQLTDFGFARAFNADSGKEVAMSTTIVGGCNCPPEIVFAKTKRVHYTFALDVWCFGCIALDIGNRGHAPFHNPQGHQGLRNKIISIFGTPSRDIILKYGWTKAAMAAASGPSAVDTISWGLWRGEGHRGIIQQTLRYDMACRPDMQTCHKVFVRG